jgi:hypothetical protein
MIKQAESMASMKNPCRQHPLNEIEYICKSDKEGLCSDCVLVHEKLHHEILPLDKTSKKIALII